MDLDQIKTRAAEIATKLEELDAIADWSEEQRAEFDTLTEETRQLDARRKDIEARANVRKLATDLRNVEAPEAPQVLVRKDPYDLNTLSVSAGAHELRERAMTAIERTAGLPDSNKEAATRTLSRVFGDRRGQVGLHMLATGSDAYRQAFIKAAVTPELLDESDRKALQFARAMSLTGNAGGFAVPFTLDPTIISTNDVSTNPVRRVARVVQIVTDEWNGVSSGGVTFSWDGEAAEVSDDAPTLGQPSIDVHKAQGFIPMSIEINQDYAGIEADLRQQFQEGKDDLEGAAFITGTGTNQPTGIVTALTGTASEVNAAADDTFAIADVYTLEAALPPKYRLSVLDGDTQSSRATWMANRAIYQKIRQFDTSGGAGLWETLGNGLPARLLGYPALEASAMDGTITTSGAVSNFILLLGDFRNYVIVDRVGLAVELVPHLFHTSNNRPSGQRGLYAFYRVGGDSVNDDGFRMLDVASAA